jgi:hypothetical protein
MLTAKADLRGNICKVCGRKPGRYDSLCFGVHANCSNHLRVQRIGFMFRVQDERRPEHVWFCNQNGMKVIEGIC